MIQFLNAARDSEDQSLLKASEAIKEIISSGEFDDTNSYVDSIIHNEGVFILLYETYDHLRRKERNGEWSRKVLKILDLMVKTWFFEFSIEFEKERLGFSHLMSALERVTIG